MPVNTPAHLHIHAYMPVSMNQKQNRVEIRRPVTSL